MGRSTEVWVVLPTFRRSSGVVTVVESVLAQDRPVDRFLIVDNDSSAVELVLPSEDGLVEVVRPGENLGPAGATALAMNAMLDECAGDAWILRLDDDRPLPRDSYVSEMLVYAGSLVDEDPQVGGVGLVGARYDRRRARLIRVADEELTGPVVVDYLATNHFPLFRLAAIRDAGPMDADLFFGSSEVEFGVRVSDAGWKLVADGNAWRELRAARAGRERNRQNRQPAGTFDWRRFYSIRNQVHLARRYSNRAAATVTARQVFGGPLRRFPSDPGRSVSQIRSGVRAARDGWAGRLGRTVEPHGESSGDVPDT
ncbi:glycosyltransferase [Actinospongicola halichondriae]|uniref:glycosyltransferase n=1 Tax=Actinospongicola halichondriae TaxID=3236844 RepID=UPI003D4FB4D4